MANTDLTRTTGTPTNVDKFTISVWLKRGNIGINASIIGNRADGNNRSEFSFRTDDTLRWEHVDGGSNVFYFQTNRKFRDTNGWMHIVFGYDSSQGTSTNRWKLYINGVQETSFSASMYPAQNANSRLNASGQAVRIGSRGDGNEAFDGSMSHFHFIDGTQYAASDFGSTDSTTGEWKINTSPSLTYGNNGFFVLKDGNSLTDQSPNTNNFTLNGGTLTKTEDCPSNVFVTLNPNHHVGSAPRISTLSHGNTRCADANSDWQGIVGTLGASSGKYYWEYNIVGGVYHMVGIVPDNGNFSQSGVYTIDYGGMGYSGYIDNGTIRARFNNSDISGWNPSGMGNTTFGTSDILQIAVDMDNKYMYIGKNGTWLKSGDPTSGSSGTGGINISATFTSGVFMLPALSVYSGATGQFNFGNGYMGTTAVSSAGTNASGIGIFEYDVPTGYTALSTKGLNL